MLMILYHGFYNHTVHAVKFFHNVLVVIHRNSLQEWPIKLRTNKQIPLHLDRMYTFSSIFLYDIKLAGKKFFIEIRMF